MFADIHHEIAQASGLDLVTLAALGGSPVQRFGEAGIKFAVKPAEKIGGINIHRFFRQSFFHEFLHRDMGQTELLVVTLGLIVREIALHRPLDVAGYGFMALDQVGIIAVHFADQIRHPLEHQGE